MADSENDLKNDMNTGERREARRRESPSAAVVYEAIRHEAEAELRRPLPGLGWSALAAGLSMGFSFVAQALLMTYIPDAEWQPVISSFGYAVGFLFVILGRQQLFTENTLTPILEVLRVKNWCTVRKTLNLWMVVLLFNMVGTAIFAWMLFGFEVLDPSNDEALAKIASHEYENAFGQMFVKAIFAGWLVALMLWLMPFAGSGRVGVIVIVTYVIGLANFPHIVAGSVAALYSVYSGVHTIGEFFGVFFIPTLMGNMVGGIMLVGAVNYAQVAYSQLSKEES